MNPKILIENTRIPNSGKFPLALHSQTDHLINTNLYQTERYLHPTESTAETNKIIKTHQTPAHVRNPGILPQIGNLPRA